MVRVSAFFSAFSFLSLPSYGFLCEIAKLPKTDGPRPVLKNANFFTIRHALRVLLYTIDDDEWAVSGGDGQEGRSKFARAYFEQWWYTYFINIFFLVVKVIHSTCSLFMCLCYTRAYGLRHIYLGFFSF